MINVEKRSIEIILIEINQSLQPNQPTDPTEQRKEDEIKIGAVWTVLDSIDTHTHTHDQSVKQNKKETMPTVSIDRFFH